MPAPLLETKLYVPRARPGLVPRRRLSDLLDRGISSTLTLVSAPAGFGKSTLLAQWLAATTDERSAGWLSLDRADNDPVSFWTYVVAALRTVAPEVGSGAVTLLADSPPPSFESVLTTLLNDLGAVPKDIVLVLDDYHVIESRDIHDGVAFLLDHLPARLHLVIASRADPPFPLARLRARGELVEVRAADLRFTADEAAAYLNDRMGLELTVDDVAALEGRTEGWIAALQLAALSLQGRDDVAGFIDGFAGDDRYVVDYLVEEVVQRLSDPVQRFLLQTSILARLSGPLCDAVTGQDDGKATLEELDRRNLFLVPLDDRRRWYRYHHLFGDVLRARLLDELPDLVPDLHRRASAWYEQHGEPDVAIDHALAAGDAERAADLVEIAAPATQRERREATLRGWLERLPEDLFPDRPVLSIYFVGALMVTGTIEGVEPRLQDAERWVAAHAHEPVALAMDAAGVRRLPGWIAVYRAGLALATGDAAATMTYGRRALEVLHEDDDLGHAAATTLMGLASWGGGDLAAAHTAYATGMVRMRHAGHIADVLGCAITLADLQMTLGRLGEAMHTFEENLQLAAAQGGPVLRGTADMHVGMSTIHRERGDLPAAIEHLLRSQQLGDHLGLPKNPHRSRIAMALVRETEGDLGSAVELLEEAERLYAGDYSPDVRPVSAMRARVRVRQGELDDALAWARDRGLSADDELSYLREFEHVTFARILLARRSTDEAARLLERVLEAADEGGRAGSAIEILVLQALAHQQAGDTDAALVPLSRALAMAEPEGYVRVFVDEGAPMTRLLRAAEAADVAPSYVRRLLTAAEATETPAPRDQDLVEPLSERELDVLRLLRTELSGPEIARELFVSLNTVRTHTKSIYAKLGVNSRRAAVRRADGLGLTGPGDH
jgi:LuxR family transcriptional regulator, maltose regulon positive regulatory protein